MTTKRITRVGVFSKHFVTDRRCIINNLKINPVGTFTLNTHFKKTTNVMS